MPKRNIESNQQRQPRRFSRKVLKTLQNAYRKYLNDSREKIRYDIRHLMRLNRTIVKCDQKRSNKIGLGFTPSTSFCDKNPSCATFYGVECHGNHMTSKGG